MWFGEIHGVLLHRRFFWRLRLWSNRRLHAHGKGFLLQILFHAAENIPCYVHVNISMILRNMTAGTIRLCRMKKWNQLGNSWLTAPVLTVEVYYFGTV